MCSSSCGSKKSEDSIGNINITCSSSSANDEDKLCFPAAARLCRSVSCSPRNINSKSDSSVSDSKLVRTKKRNRRKKVRTLAPIGVFWDIENCQVPRTKSATSVVQRIRELFYNDYREAEFLVVCDVKKESAQVVQDLNDAQVNVIHVSCISKNAADEKLRQSLRRFAELHKAPAAIALITSDINFAADLSDLRYRRKMRVILIHNSAVADALLLCACETFNFGAIMESLPPVLRTKTTTTRQTDLCVFNLPVKDNPHWANAIKSRLRMLSYNCGGKVIGIYLETGSAILRFSSLDFAIRAQKRLEGEDVFGSAISVSNPTIARDSPIKNYAGRKVRNFDATYRTLPNVMSQDNSSYDGTTATSSNSFAKTTWKTEGNQQESFNVQQSTFRPIRGTGYMDVSYLSQDTAIGPSLSSDVTTAPVELIISNLDTSINHVDLRNLLLKTLKQYAMVLNLAISLQRDGSQIANVKVGSPQEAQLVISKLHHLWGIGDKRVSVSLARPNSNFEQLKMIVSALLQEVPNKRMPLFKFFELVESRYRCNITLSEVNKLKDVCRIIDGHNGRMIALTSATNMSPISTMLSSLYCIIHCPNSFENRGWGEAEDISLPNIKISLKMFAIKVNELLASHMGHLPLLSLPICYSSQFGQPLPIDEKGVPLEHLVTCISNVELNYNGQNKNVKFLCIKDERDKDTHEKFLLKSVSPSLMPNINMLCREVVDLLKTTEGCQLLLSRFIPAYHRHFGRQCCVANYGFTRLIDLFEAISHVVQILGLDAKRTITLTHSSQIRRFTSDVLRVLKSQNSKQLTLSDFPVAYEKVLNKPFNPVDYGLCSLDDLLEEIPGNTIIITTTNNVVTIRLPKREQTADEIQKTAQFASEAFELLRHSPYCSMLFDKFVPAYHHHFGRQCKVSDYGFTKLIELFEAIPETVELESASDVDKKVKLTLPLCLKVLGTQVQTLIKESITAMLPMDILTAAYKWEYGYTLKTEAYACSSLEELVSKLSDYVQVTQASMGPTLMLADSDSRTIGIQAWSLLLQPPHCMNLMVFIDKYHTQFCSFISITKLKELKDVIVLIHNGTGCIVSLTNFYMMAARLYHLLYISDGHIQLAMLQNIYFRKFNRTLCPSEFGAHSLEDLFRQMNFLVVIEGGKDLTVNLNQGLSAYGIPLPPTTVAEQQQPNKEEESPIWPPAPLFGSITNFRRNSPPKPDTPPSQKYYDSSIWGTPTWKDNEESLNLAIPLPSVDVSKVVSFSDGLMSPNHTLVSSNNGFYNPAIPKIAAPHPASLPLPDKFIANDDSHDSGVNSSTKIECTSSDNELYLSESFPRAPGTQSGHFRKSFSAFSNM